MLITSKYTGKCIACGKSISPGDRVSWIKGRKGVEHAACSAESAEAKEIETSVEASRALDADIEIPAPDGLSYLPYQRGGIAYALARRGTLIGDEMGLGKTIQAIGVVNADVSIRSVLVIAPKSLTVNWVRELDRWQTRDLSVGRANGKIPDAAIVVSSYEEAKKHETVLCERGWDLVIIDEAHYIKNSRSQRSKTVTAIGQRARKVIALTGTPLPNRPIELFPILKLVDPEHWDQGPKGGFFRFARRYANAHHNGYGWDFSGACNLPELQEKLRATCMVRRLKKDVLTDLPAKRRQIVELPRNGASRAVDAESAAWDRISGRLEELQAEVELARAGSDDEYETAVAKLRQATSAAFAEDRAHRIGQTESVLVQHLVLDGSLDARMAHILVEKQRIADLGLDLQIKAEPVLPTSPKSSTSRKEIADLAERLTDDQVRLIHAGLRRLAGVCDGARAEDGHGFNKLDTHIGHELAARSDITKRQAALGWKLCRKYRRQLGEEFIDSIGVRPAGKEAA